MTCEQFSTLLSQWLEGDLSPQQAQDMLAHTQECRDCAELSHTLRLILDEAEQMGCEKALPEAPQQAWREAIRREAARPVGKVSRVPGWKRFSAIAAAIFLLVAATLLTREHLASPQAPQAAKEEEVAGLQMAALDVGAAPPLARRTDSDVLFASDDAATDPLRPAGTLLERGAQFTLSTQHFDIDAEKLLLLPQELGGWVAQQNLSGRSYDEEGDGRSLTLSLRIPVERLEEAQGYMDSIGQLEARETYARDISSEYYDVQGRLESAQGLHAQFQTLLGQTSDVETLITLTREINENQRLMDSLQGSLDGMDTRVQYSNITVYLTERAPRTIMGGGESRSLGSRIATGFSDSLQSIRSFLADLVVALVWLLPWLLPLALLVFLFVYWWRRKRRA